MSTLDPQFLIATMHITAFKRGEMIRAQAALLTMALTASAPITAADLPGELTNGSKSLPGAASGGLIAQNLLVAVGRVPSPHKNAHGRKLNQLVIPSDRRGAARAWLKANDCPVPQPQGELALT